MPVHPLLRHRGFEVSICKASDDEAFAFTVAHLGLTLYISDTTFRTATSADRAARCYVDDALAAFEAPAIALAA